jgi:signal transduction histidine kinase
MHFDKHGTVKFVNKWHARVFAKGKLDKDYFLNRKITELPGIQSAGIETELEKILHGETVFLPMVHIPRFAAGHEGYQCIRGVPIFWKDEVQGGILIREDITEQKRTEEEKTRLDHQLKEAQKLEALGRMAGAVAHHFNNQLSIVMGRLELSLEIIEDIWIRRHVDEAIHASHRAAHISRQMLAYLGKKDTKKARLDLSELCRQHLKIINSGIAEGINLVADLQAIGPVVYCNAHDLKEALTALVTNACEAIEDFFGQVILRTGTIEASQINRYELFPAGWGPSENDYACLEVSDTGSGIEEENIIKIFDPFFSTKFVGRGLGLPVVLGMARGNGGGVGVQSKPGSGTKISLFLPLESITSG